MSQVPDVYQCQLCCRFHALQACACFRKMSVAERIEAVRVHKYCTNCLARSHTTGACSSKNSCRICKLGHHTLLHRPPNQRTVERKREPKRRIRSARSLKSKNPKGTKRLTTRRCVCGRQPLQNKRNSVARAELKRLVSTALTPLLDLQRLLNVAPVQGRRHVDDEGEGGGNSFH